LPESEIFQIDVKIGFENHEILLVHNKFYGAFGINTPIKNLNSKQVFVSFIYHSKVFKNEKIK
jgi:hypothetical protein